MSIDDFFKEIEHPEVSWRDYQLHVRVFYQHITSMSVSFLTPIERILKVLPSKRLNPYRITPWHAALNITAYRYLESDLGPYNEVSISIPVTIDEETPIFTGILRKGPKIPQTFSLHLPVTTEIARVVGAEFAGYPKFIADIEFKEDGEWLTCDLRLGDEAILTLSGRKLVLESYPRYRVNPITYRRGFLLRSEFVISERELGSSRNGSDVKLELGTHAISDQLRGLNLGKVLGYQFCPRSRGILTSVFESFKGS